MKATEFNFLQFLQGTKQFVIPIYQRTYSWTTKQCRQFLDDIVRAAQDVTVPAHFVGSIVYISNSLYTISSIPQLLVIDGQQRLTTLSLLLAALGRVIEDQVEESTVTPDEINDYYLYNKHGKGDLRYKLLLTQSDKETFIRMIEGKAPPEAAATRVVDTYTFFLEQLRTSGIPLNVLYQGIAKLMIVDISLERDRDNPQLIFESLNSTGLALSEADRIRNFVLMGLEPELQSHLYTEYWYPMEQSFRYVDDASVFDRFIRDYLTVKTRRIPNINEVYSDFKAYMQGGQAAGVEALVADINQHAHYFANLVLHKEKDAEINRILKDISTLKVDVVYPFLVELYDDYARKRLGRADFVAILRLVESYIFRRTICGIPTNALNRVFATLAAEIDKSEYVHSTGAALLLKTLSGRFPADAEFGQALMVKDVYNFRSRNYLLRKLENFDRKETVDVEQYTIEHILPQNENLSQEWQAELGPDWQTIQATYLHTIGNLTLTGYNAELSDRPFRTKRDMKGGFADSPIRLNRSLASVDRWDEAAIRDRAAILSDLAMVVWPTPQVPADLMVKYRKAKAGLGGRVYRVEDHTQHLHGPMLAVFEELRRRILNLDASVREEARKPYIAYKTSTNFVDVVLQRNRHLLYLNIPFSEIDDPKGLCRDVTKIGTRGNGDVEVGISALPQLDDVMALIRQSFEKQREENSDVYQLSLLEG